MKNKIKINVLGIIMITTSLLSCTDILDQTPTTNLSAEGFFTSADNIEYNLTACYSLLQDNTCFTWQTLLFDGMTDNAYDYSNYNGETTIAQGPITPTIGGLVDAIYNAMYEKITRCNIFLKMLGEYTGSDMTTETKTMWEAEVKTIRAWCYFNLYKFYGSVPLVTEPLTMENQYQPKVDENEILAQITEDLNFAIANLPDKAYRNTEGHFVKSSAQVLKCRVLLFDAYDDNGNAIPNVMSQVKSIMQEIMSKSYYSITPNYRGLFVGDIGMQTNNGEFIFTINYLEHDNTATFAFGWSLCKCLLYTAESPGGSFLPLKNFGEEFEFIDGTPFSTDNALYDPQAKFKNRDPRMAYTMYNKTVSFENGFSVTNPTSVTGYSFWKFLSGSDAQDYNSTAHDGSDWVAMRYAEVLLMYAEAANEVDGATSDVYSAVNQIRDRGNVKMPPLRTGLSKDEMRNAIRHERRIELAFEGFRYDDLKRWKIAEDRLNMTAQEAVVTRYFEQKNYHFPIPQDEINVNQGVLVQNPDYQ
ncbi:MAG: RagB/SusD family nutrient uptake outer membrane protein [Mangrovibacterium sp.]